MDLSKKIRILLFCCTLLFISVLIVSCSTPKAAVNIGPDGVAIKGYDTVAYFTMGKPVKGDEKYAYEWDGAKWLFSSKAHLDLFAAEPDKYAPQYGGY